MIIAIDKILVGTRRKPNPEKIKEIAASIEAVGQINPIIAYRDGDSTSKTAPVHLVAGLHRLEALKLLGREMAEVDFILEDKAEIVEIDENLMREELTELERSTLIKRRREIFVLRKNSEELTPHTARHRPVDPTSAHQFDKETAAMTGQSVSSVEKARKRGERIADDVREAIAEMPAADTAVELDALADLAPDEQRQAVDRVRNGADSNFREARAFIRGEDSDMSVKQMAALRRAWLAASDQVKAQFKQEISEWTP